MPAVLCTNVPCKVSRRRQSRCCSGISRHRWAPCRRNVAHTMSNTVSCTAEQTGEYVIMASGCCRHGSANGPPLPEARPPPGIDGAECVCRWWWLPPCPIPAALLLPSHPIPLGWCCIGAVTARCNIAALYEACCEIPIPPAPPMPPILPMPLIPPRPVIEYGFRAWLACAGL